MPYATKRLFVLTLAAPLLASPCKSFAQDATTAPTTTPSDDDDARNALKRLQGALANGDVNTVRELLISHTPQQQRLDAALIRLTGSLGHLRQACDAAFGTADVNRADGLGDPTAEANDAAALFDHAAITRDGPDARIFRLGQSPLVRVERGNDGAWKVPLSPPPAANDPGTLMTVFEQIERQATQFDAVADEVSAGKYKTMRETMGMLHTRLMQAAVPSTTP